MDSQRQGGEGALQYPRNVGNICLPARFLMPLGSPE